MINYKILHDLMAINKINIYIKTKLSMMVIEANIKRTSNPKSG